MFSRFLWSAVISSQMFSEEVDQTVCTFSMSISARCTCTLREFACITIWTLEEVCVYIVPTRRFTDVASSLLQSLSLLVPLLKFFAGGLHPRLWMSARGPCGGCFCYEISIVESTTSPSVNVGSCSDMELPPASFDASGVFLLRFNNHSIFGYLRVLSCV